MDPTGPEVLISEPRLDDCRDSGSEGCTCGACASVVHGGIDLREQPVVGDFVELLKNRG